MKFKLGIILAILLLVMTGCSEHIQSESGSQAQEGTKTSYEKSDFVLGTIVSVKIFEDGSDAVLENIFGRLSEIEKKMSFNSTESEVIEVNAAAGKSPVVVSEDTFEVISRAVEFADLSSGKFDPTIGPLVDLWGIGSESAAVPSEDNLMHALEKIGWSKVELDGYKKSVYLTQENMKLDLGAIAKGYASDEVVRILKDNNVGRAVINLGGNVYAYGEKEDGSAWRIGIQNPFTTRGEYLGIVEVKNKSVVTSGIYERYFEENGVRYHHILSTETGYPVENELASVTVITQSSIDADALSTVLFAKGVEAGMTFLENNFPEAGAAFITRDNRIYSRNLDQFNIDWTDSSFEVVQ